ncbi:MAG: phenylalanine--tRNA ligase subunit beta [Candidatus Omnitrophica bacterium]|nr:phenylalanine--tRNA ligase subunit beta [Candidatus Omnitrophota bacterium]
MKISLNWLKDYVTVGVSAEKLAHKLTMAGFEVEKITTVDADTVFELEITPNRPDCLNMRGMAREVAAILNTRLKPVKMPGVKFPSRPCDIKILDKKGCPRYLGTFIRGAAVADAPEWIKRRLCSVGSRSINNVVDITNFCLMETGQPLHAFDYDKLCGGRIIVRRAQEGETITTIDGVERKLDPSILIIADEKRPVAIAGVIGGKDTEVTQETKNILLESAYFDPILIRQAGRRLGVSSESSYRFERGVDYDAVGAGADRAVRLVLDCAGGIVAGRCDIRAIGKRPKSAVIVLNIKKANNFLGISLAPSRYKKILRQLGFQAAGGKKDTLRLRPPAFRSDLKEEVDVVEEVARVIGYDNLPVSLPAVPAASIVSETRRGFRQAVRELLLAQGVNETITYAMVSEKSLVQARQGHLGGVRIQNPLASDQGVLRPSLLPSLLSVVAFNINRGQKNLKLFEAGKIYTASGEREALGVVLAGRQEDDWREGRKGAFDFYDIKGVVEQTLARTCGQEIRIAASPCSFLVPGQGVSVAVGGVVAGFLGKVDGGVLEAWDIKQKNVFFAQIDLEELRSFFGKERTYRPISEFPAIVRDVSLAVGKDVSFQQVCATAFRLGRGILHAVKFSGEYRGEKIPAGNRGIVFSLRYKSDERTLREEEVNEVHEKIVRALVSELGAIQR